MNRVCLLGRLTAKPELRYTSTNIPTTRFSIAVNRNFTNSQGQREADFINIVAWRKQAELICQYFDKGSLIALEGRIQTGSYDDKDGNRRSSFDVVVDTIHFVGGKKDSSPSTSSSAPTPYYYADTPHNDVDVNDDPFAEFGDSVSIDDNFLD